MYDPTYGHALKKSFGTRRITPEYTMRLTTNSLGFRGPEPTSAPLGTMLFLGDSFTLGVGVNDGEEFPALVRKALAKRYGDNQVPVINAGLSHSGQGRWVKFLRDQASRYDPRIVVLQLVENDFYDNVRERLFDLTPPGDLVELPVPPPGTARAIQKVVEFVPGLSHTYLLALMRQVYHGLRESPDPRPSRTAIAQQDDLTLRLLEEALAICKTAKWPVLALVVDIEGSRSTKLEELFERYDVPVIEIAGSDEHPELYYPKYGHWNALGHAFAANLIVQQLSAWNEAFAGATTTAAPFPEALVARHVSQLRD
jgi:lysophospholipase L1-like esterase